MSWEIPYIDRIFDYYLWDYISQNLFVWIIIPVTLFLFSLFFEKPRNLYIRGIKFAFNAILELVPYRIYNKNKSVFYQIEIFQRSKFGKYSYKLFDINTWNIIEEQWYSWLTTESLQVSICKKYWFRYKHFIDDNSFKHWDMTTIRWTIKLSNEEIKQ